MSHLVTPSPGHPVTLVPPLPGIPAVYTGHATHASGRTGCTVILCPSGAIAGVSVRGAAPGTRETDLLRPGNLVERAQAILLSGGSAFGLAAADGVMRWLHERGHGFATAATPVPIVPAAVLYDLQPDAVVWPDAAIGYESCNAAYESSPESSIWGRVGAGAGATVGKLRGAEHASLGGIGYASVSLSDGAVVAAIVAVNALGDVVDPRSGAIIAGTRADDGAWADSTRLILDRPVTHGAGENTTIGCVITSARLDKAACCRVADVAHDGLARAIRPAHTQSDGDTLFALSAPRDDSPPADLTRIGVAAAEAVTQAILNAVISRA
jgi:L-aminopeptidase/D-esterase-like protein